MPDSTEKALAAALSDSTCFGQIVIRKSAGGFILCHRDDAGRDDLGKLRGLEEATEIARWDDAGNYRPLKTAPNLRHGWSLEVVDLGQLRHALDYFYPGRLAVLVRWKKGSLTTTPLRETLNRQSGMYRVTAKISDEQIEDLVGNFCRSNGGCLRTILWKRDNRGTVPSKKLPPEKFEPSHDQTGPGETAFPLLCQEPCNLLVAACRKVVKGEADE
jgi:sirohydrochlorin cobaltochelatase